MTIQLYNPDELDALPKLLKYYGASDYATMEPKKGKKEPDFTEHGVFGMDANHHLWAVDWWFGQVETDKGINAWVNLLRKRKMLGWWNEGGLIDKAIGPSIRRAMTEANKFVAVHSLPSLQDKGIKLQAFHARCTALTVHFPVRRKWADRVIEQLIKFPAGRWDDGADVCGLIGRAVDEMYEPQLPEVVKRPILVPFTEKWIEFNDRSDKPKVRYF